MAAPITNIKGTLLGPLTTTWTPPASCTPYIQACSGADCTEGFLGQTCLNGQPRDHTGCWPPTTRGAGTPQQPFNGWGFYSPGLACPSGYVTACTATYGGRADGWLTEFALLESESAVGCCPSGFACHNKHGQTCVATATTSTEVALPTCNGNGFIDLVATLPDVFVLPSSTITDGSTVRTVSPSAARVTRVVTLYAPMFQLNFQPSDLANGSTPTTGGTTQTQGPGTSSLSSGGVPSGSTAASTDDGEGISTGAKAGIGAGIGVGALALAGLLGWCIMARRRRRRRMDEPLGPGSSLGYDQSLMTKSPMTPNSDPYKSPIYYYGTPPPPPPPPTELVGTMRPQELDSRRPHDAIHELG